MVKKKISQYRQNKWHDMAIHLGNMIVTAKESMNKSDIHQLFLATMNYNSLCPKGYQIDWDMLFDTKPMNITVYYSVDNDKK